MCILLQHSTVETFSSKTFPKQSVHNGCFVTGGQQCVCVCVCARDFYACSVHVECRFVNFFFNGVDLSNGLIIARQLRLTQLILPL